jgi:hypothetical protein
MSKGATVVAMKNPRRETVKDRYIIIIIIIINIR